MKLKNRMIAAIVIVMAVAGFGDAMLAVEDLCGGTGGNGEIVSVGNDTFTIEQKDHTSRIVSLTDQAEIMTSTGPVSLSALKAGDRVTLVGGPNPDGSFSADTVFLCNGTSQNTPVIERKGNMDYKKISSAINSATLLLSGLIWLCIVLFLRFKKKKSLTYVFFFTLFYVYLFKVLDYTQFQFQSLLLLNHFLPGALMLRGETAVENMNLVPLLTLTPEDLKTSLLNILLMIPFGFGLPFITTLRLKKIVMVGALFSIGIECLQLITGLVAHMTFRIVDINDVIFNTLGVASGYIVFVGFIHAYRRLFHKWKTSTNPILQYIGERPQGDSVIR